jgi:hypothetical protein
VKVLIAGCLTNVALKNEHETGYLAWLGKVMNVIRLDEHKMSSLQTQQLLVNADHLLPAGHEDQFIVLLPMRLKIKPFKRPCS